MNKITMLALVLCTLAIINTSSAQIAKGTSLLGGSVSYANRTVKEDNEYKTSNFGITPSYGIAIRDNFVIGGNVSFGISKNETVNPFFSTKEETFDYGLGVFARNYKNLGNSGFLLFLHSGLQGGLNNQNTTNSQSIERIDRDGFSVNLHIYPGVAYAVSECFLIETSLSNLFGMEYSNYKTSRSDVNLNDGKSRTFGLYSGIGSQMQFSVGAHFLFRKKR